MGTECQVAHLPHFRRKYQFPWAASFECTVARWCTATCDFFACGPTWLSCIYLFSVSCYIEGESVMSVTSVPRLGILMSAAIAASAGIAEAAVPNPPVILCFWLVVSAVDLINSLGFVSFVLFFL